MVLIIAPVYDMQPDWLICSALVLLLLFEQTPTPFVVLWDFVSFHLPRQITFFSLYLHFL